MACSRTGTGELIRFNDASAATSIRHRDSGGGKWRFSRHIAVRENQFASGRTFSLCASFYSLFPISFSPFVISSLKTLRGRSADRRHCPVTAPRRRALPLVGARGAGAPYGARSPTGAPPRFLHRRTNATAQPQAALPGTRLRNGRYPSPPVPVQRASRRPVIVPAGRLPRAARERVTNPARGNRTRSVSGIVSRNALTRARCFRFKPIRRRLSNGITELGMRCHCKSLTQRRCSRETLDSNAVDTRCGRNRKSI
jgi:hypothetical protein